MASAANLPADPTLEQRQPARDAICKALGISAEQYDTRDWRDRTYARSVDLAAELLEALQEAHRALNMYEWYNNPKSGWASADNTTVRGIVDAALAKARGEAS